MKTSWTSAPLCLAVASHVLAQSDAPTARTVNGTYRGAVLPDWDQDAFLGIPYAQPPVGQLRWKWPQSINSSFSETRDATRYGFSCPQYGTNFALSEDCLTINVVRPAQKISPGNDNNNDDTEKLPVLVWIYGGGLSGGSTADPQYNLSGIVKVSQDLSQPIIAVSMNYRLGIWGFMQSPQIVAEGSSNAGLVDQRLALQWVQENIASFGGDPEKVVVWGESAGAQSIAYQMLAYGGRDDGLFRGAILESGGPHGCQVETLSWYNSANENLARSLNCSGAKDQLACLRGVDQDALYAARQNIVWNPLLDGDLLQAYPSQLLQDGKLVRIPIITGANTDETFAVAATGAASSTLMNTERDIFNALLSWRSYSLTPPTIRALLNLYPDNPCTQPPYAITNCTRNPSKGLQWRRAAQIGSDMVMISGRRKLAELLTLSGQAVWSYRFDQRPWNGLEWDGVKHFQNVAFSFQNVSGLLGPSPEYDSHAELARDIGRAYVGFVRELDPNAAVVSGESAGRRPEWPRYSLDKPQNVVLNATQSWVEDDTWRKEGIAFINSPEVSKELLG